MNILVLKANFSWLNPNGRLFSILSVNLPIKAKKKRRPALKAGFGYVFRPEDVKSVLSAIDGMGVNIVFVGHTHEPVAWRQTDGGEVEMVDEDKISIAASGKYVINVGTVGCPRSVPFASYVVVDAKEDGSVDVELRKLSFDYLGYRNSLLAANADVPIWLEDLVSRLGRSK